MKLARNDPAQQERYAGEGGSFPGMLLNKSSSRNGVYDIV
jgi:hypothetical protein